MFFLRPSLFLSSSAAADEVKSEEVASEGRLNGEKDPPEETEERKEDKNGFKTRFMFNIADGGFTGREGRGL